MMSRCLGNHSTIFRFKELHYYEGLVNPSEVLLSKDKSEKVLSSLLWKQREEFLSKIDINKYLEESESLLKGEKDKINIHDLFNVFLTNETKRNSKNIACEQTPRNVFYANQILKNFDEALIINMVRDPRPIMLSQKKKWKINKFNGFENVPFANTIRLYFNYHPVLTSKLWNSAINAGLKNEDDSMFFTIKYEDFLLDPEGKLKDICKKVGIDYEEQMLDIETTSTSYVEDLNKKGIITDKIDKWKTSKYSDTEMYICQKICKRGLEYYKYDNLKLKPNYLLYIGYYIILPFKVLISLIFNLSRNKNIFKTIIKRVFG